MSRKTFLRQNHVTLDQCSNSEVHSNSVPSQLVVWVRPRFFLPVGGNCFKSNNPWPEAPKMKFLLTADMHPDLIGDTRNKTAVSHEKVSGLLAPC